MSYYYSFKEQGIVQDTVLVYKGINDGVEFWGHIVSIYKKQMIIFSRRIIDDI